MKYIINRVKFIPVLLLLFFSTGVFSQTRIYQFIDKTATADINPRLHSLLINSFQGTLFTDKAYLPVKGKYVVYRFLATYQGSSFTGTDATFHDILIVKTDKKSTIISAYQYTLEWTDAIDYDLYKSSCKNVRLTDSTRLSQFLFKRNIRGKDASPMLKEEGIIKLK
jgi:hypothetical protein